VARKRAVLTALIDRIEMSVDQIDIRLRPPRLGVLLDVTATPLQSMTADEIQTLSVPVHGRFGEVDQGRSSASSIHHPTPTYR
jgi:hypothetical protein